MRTKKQILAVAIVGCILMVIIGILRALTFPHLLLKAEYSRPIELQIFYDIGSGFNEIDSKTVQVTEAQKTVWLRLPSQSIHAVRIDFGENPGEVTVDAIALLHISKLKMFKGSELQAAFSTKGQIQSESVENDRLVLFSELKDPHIIGSGDDVRLQAGSKKWALLQAVLLRVALMGLLVLIYTGILAKRLSHHHSENGRIAADVLIRERMTLFKGQSPKRKRSMLVSSLVLGCFVSLACGTLNFNSIFDAGIAGIDILIGSAVCFFFLLFLLHGRIELRLQKIPKREWLGYSLLVFLCLLILFAAYYPAIMTSDSINQWKQVESGAYNDWHPLVHTILFMYLPSQLWAYPASATLLQLAFIAAIMGYTAYSLRSFGVSRALTGIFMLLFLMHPSNLRISVALWKDVSYSFSLLALSVMCMWIYFSEGEWIKKKIHLLFFCAAGLGVLLLRHNGIISFCMTVLCLAAVYKHYRKTFALIGVLLLVLQTLLTGPIYDVLKVYKYQLSFSEAMGVPLNQIAHIMNSDGQITGDQRGYFNEIAPIEQWKAFYRPNSIDELKWATDAAGNQYMEPTVIEADKKKFIKEWMSLIAHNMGLALESYFYVSQVLWDFQVRYDGVEKLLDVSQVKPVWMLAVREQVHGVVLKYIHVFENSLLQLITPSVGLAFFIMNVASAAGMAEDRKKMIPYIPILANTLGMLLLISCDVVRYTYVNIVAYFPILLFVLLRTNTHHQSDQIEIIGEEA